VNSQAGSSTLANLEFQTGLHIVLQGAFRL
jgi:hypothetical protein